MRRARYVVAIVLAGRLALAQGDAEITHPVAVHQVEATYPEGLAPQHADVILIVTLDAQGNVTDVKVETSGGAAFDEAAVQAVRKWTFSPATKNGKPFAARMKIPFHFEPPKPPEPPPPEPTPPPEKKTPPPEQPPPPQPKAKASDVEDVHVYGPATPPLVGVCDVRFHGGEIWSSRATPQDNATKLLQTATPILITNEGGEGHAEAIFSRGFDAREGQDIELTANGVPINEAGNLHANGYADTHFIIPELVRAIRVVEGPFDPRQGNFAVVGSADYRARSRPARRDREVHGRRVEHASRGGALGPRGHRRAHVRGRRDVHDRRLRPEPRRDSRQRVRAIRRQARRQRHLAPRRAGLRGALPDPGRRARRRREGGAHRLLRQLRRAAALDRRAPARRRRDALLRVGRRGDEAERHDAAPAGLRHQEGHAPRRELHGLPARPTRRRARPERELAHGRRARLGAFSHEGVRSAAGARGRLLRPRRRHARHAAAHRRRHGKSLSERHGRPLHARRRRALRRREPPLHEVAHAQRRRAQRHLHVRRLRRRGWQTHVERRDRAHAARLARRRSVRRLQPRRERRERRAVGRPRVRRREPDGDAVHERGLVRGAARASRA